MKQLEAELKKIKNETEKQKKLHEEKQIELKKIDEAEKQKKTIFVYGYSNAYGRYENQHEKSVEMLKEVYPDYNITCSNEGY